MQVAMHAYWIKLVEYPVAYLNTVATFFLQKHADHRTNSAPGNWDDRPEVRKLLLKVKAIMNISSAFWTVLQPSTSSSTLDLNVDYKVDGCSTVQDAELTVP